MLSRGPPLHRLGLIVSEAAQARPGVPSRPLAVAHTAAQRALRDQRGSATREVCGSALHVSARTHLSRVGSSQLLDSSILPHDSMHVSKVIPVSGVSQDVGSVLVDFHSSVLPTCDVSLGAAGEDVIDSLISKLPSLGFARAAVVVDIQTL